MIGCATVDASNDAELVRGTEVANWEAVELGGSGKAAPSAPLQIADFCKKGGMGFV